ncbi:hypothetical protein BC351_26110 [Paenibacillus ferrarius]|uniref:Uncharacterized protein n=1 Tax=Paenibacillus ferrarius TaxID=1469647 RepID=A0A1V4HIS0_9BACL|nr:hypothetical protein [Paenibacillus ferrarius]OPH56896.1 hypothetical protein BC351_26110 [Paenibacillus ferrarius]
MIVENHLILWNHVSLKIMDVQRIELPFGEHVHTSQLSSSALLYMTSGSHGRESKVLDCRWLY